MEVVVLVLAMEVVAEGEVMVVIVARTKGKFDDNSSVNSLGPFGALLGGWRSRVAADPQFAFKVLIEEVVGVSATVFGDMATSPNFGLNELDFLFSMLVCGELARDICVQRNILCSSGVCYWFSWDCLSNGLIKIRKKMDLGFGSPNKAPPTVLNAVTLAIHMGLSANLRHQSLNGIGFLLAKGLPLLLFKSSVFGLRLANNVLGGMTFVMLARVTGSQSAA
ncbi:hypothetical protein Hdeb2414_s0007g00245921 [Helianthus debilis subsp. tardiflorus]